MNSDHALQPKRRRRDHSTITTDGPLGSWFTIVNAILELNELHGDFRQVFFVLFRALLEEPSHEAYVRRIADYVRLIQSKYMFVRVERPSGSKRFVLGYVKCERVFSFTPRFEEMRLRLSRVPPTVLTDVEKGENKALRLAYLGETDYERALAKHSNTDHGPPLNAALRDQDEESAVALLDGGVNPNEVDGSGDNALHIAAGKGCRPSVLKIILNRIEDVNAKNNVGNTPLMTAAIRNQLDVVTSLMNTPAVNLNEGGILTALHGAVYRNHPRIVAQLLLDSSIDCSLKDCRKQTPLKVAMIRNYVEIIKMLRDHGAPEE